MCPEHAQQLNFRKNREALKAQARAAKKQKHTCGSDAESSRRSAEKPGAMPAGANGGRRRRRDGIVERELGVEEKDKAERGEDVTGQQGEDIGNAVESSETAVNVWKAKQPQLEASKAEEFDEYFSGMFM